MEATTAACLMKQHQGLDCGLNSRLNNIPQWWTDRKVKYLCIAALILTGRLEAKCTTGSMLDEEMLWHMLDISAKGWIILQLTKSSRAIQWGAIFSAVFGWKLILISSPEAYEHRECCGLLVFLSCSLLFTTSTKHHGSHWCGWSDLSLLFTRICSLTNTCGPQHGKSTWKSCNQHHGSQWVLLKL